MSTKSIYVKNFDFGFFTEIPITVQKFEDNADGEAELVYCNHAGAVEEESTFDSVGFNGQHIQTTSKALACNKCDAYSLDNGSSWEDAPFEGER